MKCPRCQHENPSQARHCVACGAGLSRRERSKAGAAPVSRRNAPKSEGPHLHDLEKRLAEALQREAAAAQREVEALEQQAATSKILELISSSPTEIQQKHRRLVRDVLTFKGYEIIEAETGEDGVRLAQERFPGSTGSRQRQGVRHGR